MPKMKIIIGKGNGKCQKCKCQMAVKQMCVCARAKFKERKKAKCVCECDAGKGHKNCPSNCLTQRAQMWEFIKERNWKDKARAKRNESASTKKNMRKEKLEFFLYRYLFSHLPPILRKGLRACLQSLSLFPLYQPVSAWVSLILWVSWSCEGDPLIDETRMHSACVSKRK